MPKNLPIFSLMQLEMLCQTELQFQMPAERKGKEKKEVINSYEHRYIGALFTWWWCRCCVGVGVCVCVWGGQFLPGCFSVRKWDAHKGDGWSFF